MAHRGLFVTATDTGVGKTVVAAALAVALEARGRRPGLFKPVQTGNAAADPLGDAMTLRRLSGSGQSPSDIVVHSFGPPVAPLVAARLVGETIELAPILDRAQTLSARFDPLLVEGAGGLLVPVGEAWTIADLALALGFPLVVVARAGLGTVNHTLLTVREAQRLGLETLGIVLNEHGCEPDPSWETNVELIESFADVPVLGRLPSLGDELGPARLVDAVERHLRLEPLL